MNNNNVYNVEYFRLDINCKCQLGPFGYRNEKMSEELQMKRNSNGTVCQHNKLRAYLRVPNHGFEGATFNFINECD